MPDGQVLEFAHVTKRFNEVTAVSDFSARIEPGAVTAFLGPNGAGKTTTLRILLGQVRATSGTATIGGVAYPELRQPLRTIGAVLEETAYRPRRTAMRQLTIAAKANGIPLGRVDEVIRLVGLEGQADTRIGAYSLGMRQRLSVAHALLGDPGALVFDEPANGLDPEGIRWMRLLMRRLADEGRTVLVSSHVLSEVEQVADNVLVLSRGELVLNSGIEKLADPSAGSVVVDAVDRAGLTAALSRAGFDIEVLRSGLTVRGGDAGTVGAVAAEAGIALSTLVQRGPTLEDVFIELVRGGSLAPRAVAAASQLVLPAEEQSGSTDDDGDDVATLLAAGAGAVVAGAGAAAAGSGIAVGSSGTEPRADAVESERAQDAAGETQDAAGETQDAAGEAAGPATVGHADGSVPAFESVAAVDAADATDASADAGDRMTAGADVSTDAVEAGLTGHGAADRGTAAYADADRIDDEHDRARADLTDAVADADQTDAGNGAATDADQTDAGNDAATDADQTDAGNDAATDADQTDANQTETGGDASPVSEVAARWTADDAAATDGPPSDAQPTDGPSSDAQPTNGAVTDADQTQTGGDAIPAGEVAARRTADDAQPTDGPSSDAQPTDGAVTDAAGSDAEAASAEADSAETDSAADASAADEAAAGETEAAAGETDVATLDADAHDATKGLSFDEILFGAASAVPTPRPFDPQTAVDAEDLFAPRPSAISVADGASLFATRADAARSATAGGSAEEERLTPAASESPAVEAAEEEPATAGVEFFEDLHDVDDDSGSDPESEAADPRSAAVSAMLAAAARAYYDDEPKDYPLSDAQPAERGPWSVASTGVIDTVHVADPADAASETAPASETTPDSTPASDSASGSADADGEAPGDEPQRG